MFLRAVVLFCCGGLLTGLEAQSLYSGGSIYDPPSSNAINASEEDPLNPVAPIAPPRILAANKATFGYKPPPPPTKRSERSEGQCTFDQSKWHFEAQSAVANAVMFDRTTDISCDECLEKCAEKQGDSQWVCRTLNYDHRWRVCDLFAVNATSYPHFLAHYPGRDYFEFMLARPPSPAELAPPPADIEEEPAGGMFQSVHNESEVTDSELSAFGTSEDKQTEQKQKEKAIEKLAKVDKSGEGSVNEFQAVHRNEMAKTGANICNEDEVTRYVMASGRERASPGSDTQFVEGKTVEDCANACDKDELFTCVSAVHTASGCELSTTRADHGVADELVSSGHTSYIEKVCLQANLAEHTRRLWPMVSNQILVGHVLEVTDAASLEECQLACLRAEHEFSFLCRSAMWYPSDEDQNCLLNSESRLTQPDVFVPEDQGVQMVYFDVPREDSFKDSNSATRLRDEPLASDEDLKYTRWSSCEKSSTGLRYRYLKCRDRKDVRKCTKETALCNQLKVRRMKHECFAVRDTLGRRRCPHGVRELDDGRREYCSDPVDCRT